MEKRRFGRTEHMSTVASFGAAAFMETTPDVVDKTMELVIAAGVNHIDVAPGVNGQREFAHVVRDFLPAAEGQGVDITEGMNETYLYRDQLLISANPADDPAKVACVAVVQNWETKEILQVASTF